MLPQTEKILEELRALKPELDPRTVQTLRLFGSFARGEAGPASDVDLLADFAPGTSLFDLVRLGDLLEARLHRRVDLVPASSLRPELSTHILAEALLV